MLNPHGCWLNCLRLITLNRPFEPSSPKSSGDGTQSPPGALEPVGGFNPSVGWFFPSEWKNKTCSKPPTSRWVMLGKSMVILFWLNIFYMQRKTLTQLTWFICFFSREWFSTSHGVTVWKKRLQLWCGELMPMLPHPWCTSARLCLGCHLRQDPWIMRV